MIWFVWMGKTGRSYTVCVCVHVYVCIYIYIKKVKWRRTHCNWYPIFRQTQLGDVWFGCPNGFDKAQVFGRFIEQIHCKATSAVAALPPGAAENFAASWSRGLPWVRAPRSPVENGFNHDSWTVLRQFEPLCTTVQWCWGTFHLKLLKAQLLQRCIWIHLEHHSSFTCHVISRETRTKTVP